jgi:hypothetical protein
VLKGELNCKNLFIYHSEGFKNKIYKIQDIIQSENNFYVVFHNVPGNPIGHWTCFFLRDNNTVEYFDSFGSKTSYKPTVIKRFFTKHGFVFKANTKQLQHVDSENCGKFVISRIRSRHKPIDEFMKLFKNKSMTPDQIVELLVAVEVKSFKSV